MARPSSLTRDTKGLFRDSAPTHLSFHNIRAFQGSQTDTADADTWCLSHNANRRWALRTSSATKLPLLACRSETRSRRTVTRSSIPCMLPQRELSFSKTKVCYCWRHWQTHQGQLRKTPLKILQCSVMLNSEIIWLNQLIHRWMVRRRFKDTLACSFLAWAENSLLQGLSTCSTFWIQSIVMVPSSNRFHDWRK